MSENPTHAEPSGPDLPSDDARSLLGAYAVHAVDASERAAVEELVAADPEAARQLADLTAVAAILGDAVAADPPPALRDAVLSAVATTPQVGPRHAAAESPSIPDVETPVTDLASRRRPRRTQWLAIAAAVVVGAAIPTAIAVQQAQRANEVEEQQQALADLLTDPSAVVVHGTLDGGGTATAVMTDSQALVSASDLPDPGDEHVYQLWVVSGDEAASAGILADAGGSARALTDDFSPGDALAITVEPAGGSDQPTTTPVVVLSAA